MSTGSASSPSSAFEFLRPHNPLLVHLAAAAERYVHEDPNTTLLKLRQFAELLAREAAARLGLGAGPELDQARLIRELEDHGALSRDIAQVFHTIRRSGNEANHAFWGTAADAIHALKLSRQLAIWFHRAFGRDPNFAPGPFTTPVPAANPVAALMQQVEALEADLRALQEHTQVVAQRTELESELRRAAEARARAAADEVTAALELGTEAERLLALAQERHAAETQTLAAEASKVAPAQARASLRQSAAAAAQLDLDEADTRRLIDGQLRDVGWETDSQALRYDRGVRPIPGRNLAIAEWPTSNGPADYVLFAGRKPLAVVEAKRRRRNVAAAIEQAKRYSRGYVVPEDQLDPGGPWGEFRVAFLFSSNGRAFLRQLQDQSGVWFLDARDSANHARARDGWPTPDDLLGLLKQDLREADRKLAATPSDELPLRDYQHAAIRAVERTITAGQREILIAMATGTGKTRTCIGLIYRLVKAGRFRRVLFLVDRSALGDQALDAFKDVRLENQQAFTDIYDVKELGDLHPEGDTRLQIATVQGMVKRLLYAPDSAAPLSVDTYDCIVVDECHRGYTLDRELSDLELTFRSEAEYISKYRRVLDHFDAVKIGLTATPALHTTQIFGHAVFEYSYRQAVIDRVLVDHEPPFRIVTRLSEDGMHWAVGEQVSLWNSTRGQIDLFETPDEIDLEVDDYNRRVITEPFNRVICSELARHIDPDLPGKTLVYCVTDGHADMVVRLLKNAFKKQYGQVDDDAVQKITGEADRPRQKIRHFKNEKYPSVAVTVDLLTTGIDVPAIVNLVFIRRVRSRILYEQMLGRATRICEGLYGDRDKEVFYVFDAVDLYSALQGHTNMTPVVQNPQLSFAQLVAELLEVEDPPARAVILEQLIAKFQRKRRGIEDRLPEAFEAAAGISPADFVRLLRHQLPEDAARYFAAHPVLAELLDRRFPYEGQNQLISHHEDELRRLERGYGNATRPEDYLESFGRYLAENQNQIEALQIVTTRPRDLTRQQLRELKLALDGAGFSEATLRTAYREATNQDIAASIIGYIRQRALGTPLEPYEQRVTRALKRILASRSWTPPQRQWLERIGKQLTQETIVDRPALDSGQFAASGGYMRLNKIFDGRLDEILRELHDGVWKESA